MTDSIKITEVLQPEDVVARIRGCSLVEAKQLVAKLSNANELPKAYDETMAAIGTEGFGAKKMHLDSLLVVPETEKPAKADETPLEVQRTENAEAQ